MRLLLPTVTLILMVGFGTGYPGGGRRQMVRRRKRLACNDCQLELCPPTPPCPAGTVLDLCSCCWQCTKAEGQPCQLGWLWVGAFHGLCGDNLECRLEEEEEEEDDGIHQDWQPEGNVERLPRCICKYRQTLCASDNRTYENLCKLQAALVTGGNRDLTLVHEGHCKTAPNISSPPSDVMNAEGSDIIFRCAVVGYPKTFIEWRKEGNTISLPADDPRIAVQVRGEPQKYEITGWLKIQGLTKDDEGTYTCLAKNEYGEASASARLQVLQTPDTLEQNAEKFYKRGMRSITDDEDLDVSSAEHVD
ncbi:kazal-type serine protease inhibitor domain-containing protein 1-like [Heptranchias perlo]|uniref:kazal-type serine protease inhibitor domain-containing protein 1-like n=1 Tax=Heptranchias perlo TaxID=212740 RepID=UPI00355A1715